MLSSDSATEPSAAAVGVEAQTSKTNASSGAPASTAAAPTPASTAAAPAATATVPAPPPREYNPRWKGYVGILLSSLINFSAVSNIHEAPAGPALTFGIILFAFALAVLVTDRVGNKDWYTSTWDGKLEGYALLTFTVYAVTGVAFLTQVGGIAYLALNVYFTAWIMLATCLYTLNKYSEARDILTFAEMTSISATLKSWYILFLASLVTTGTSINMFVVLDSDRDDHSTTFPWVSQESLQHDNSRAAAFGTAFGLSSALISLGYILVHYNLIEFCVEGGWTELSFIAVAVCMWIVGVAFLTQDRGIAATIVGTGYRDTTTESLRNQDAYEALTMILSQAKEATESKKIDVTVNCFLYVYNVTYNCTDLLSFLPPMATDDDNDREISSSDFTIPGSNLYLSVWVCLLASLNLANRWKTQQALQFAQAQRENAMKNLKNDNYSSQERNGENCDDGDEDVDNFEDTDEY